MLVIRFIARHRPPAEVIGYAVWVYFRFLLSLRIVEEMLAARGIIVSHETIRCWPKKFQKDPPLRAGSWQ